jgi:pantoate kinase
MSGISTRVNGDMTIDARTTRRAVELMLAETGHRPARLTLEQFVDTPIGSGFGSSAASAVSAVYATASAADVKMPKRELALFAHRAEIFEQTGLGTVSVVYNYTGAGAITKPGEPGTAEFVNVKVPGDIRIVTAYVAPFDKKVALTSRTMSEKINRLGREALNSFLADPSLDALAQEGERFSERLGLESLEVKKLIKIAKSAGASYASQNMIGHSVHSVVDSDRSKKVAKAFRDVGSKVRVDTFHVGTRKARVLRK